MCVCGSIVRQLKFLLKIQMWIHPSIARFHAMGQSTGASLLQFRIDRIYSRNPDPQTGQPMAYSYWAAHRLTNRSAFYIALILLGALTIFTLNNAIDKLRLNPSASLISSDENDPIWFTKKPLVLWTTDYHIATIQDLHHLLEPYGVKIIDKSLTPRCKMYNTCGNSTNLKVLTQDNGMTLNPELIQEFFEAYKDDPVMKSVDAFVCYHPTAMCELYMPFNKSIIVVSSTRFELGRFEADRFKKWIENLQLIASDQKNFVGANNLYDARYIQYFTGIQVPILPSYCGYTGGDYNPIKPGFLTFAGRNPPSPFHTFYRKKYNDTFFERQLPDKYRFQHFRSVYNYFEFQDLANHEGVIFIPYQVSIMTIFELYRMNIPMFFPSYHLLCRWHYEHSVIKERTFHMFRFHERPNGSVVPAHPSQRDIPDPNNDRDMDAIHYWLRFADYYSMLPHIIYFDSINELFDKLQTTNLKEVSDNMRRYNKASKQGILHKWKAVLMNVARHSQNHPSWSETPILETVSCDSCVLKTNKFW